VKIVPTKPYFSETDIDFILNHFKEILEGKAFLSQHKYCGEFEKLFADYIGTKYTISVANGTCALEIILRALNLKGDIIVPTNTVAATAYAVVSAGCNPVFADCGDDLILDVDDVKKRITKNTKAIITVHIGGLVSPNTKELVEFCNDNNIYLIEDAAHAHGTTLNKRKAGTFGVAAGFSFFSTKVMTTGEGGMITTDNEIINQRARLLRNHSTINQGRLENYHEEFGYNWRMQEVNALLGITQIKFLEEFIKRRNEIARIFDEELSSLKNIKIRKTPTGVRENYYKYVVFLEKHDRFEVQKMMKEKFDVTLGGCVYAIPLHKQPAFSRKISFPVAEDLCSRHICPPMYHEMTDEEALYITDSLKKCLR